MIPYLDVSHLPSSTSFYSAVLQPLGLYYIQVPCPADGQPSPLRTVTFGEQGPSPNPILQIREVATTSSSPLKISRIVLAAPSPAAVSQVRACAARAKCALALGNLFSVPIANCDVQADLDGPCQQATITDLDGNIMEIISSHDYSAPPYQGAHVRHTQSTPREARRILNWNYDVAKSTPHGTVGQPATFQRSVTTSTYEYPIRTDAGGISAGSAAGFAVAGALVGAGLGALATYTTMKNDRSRVPVHEFEAPPPVRRSTYPERLPPGQGSSHRYVEVERTTIRYPEDYYHAASGSLHAPPPPASRYTQVSSSSRRSRAIDDGYDDNRRMTRYEGSRAGTSRTRSEAPTERAPLLLTETAHRSQVGSQVGSQASARSSHRSHSRHTSVVDMAVPAAYARSHYSDARSSTTVRPPPPPAQVAHVTELVTRNKPGSRVTETQTTIRLPSASKSQVSRPPNASRSHSIVSARHIPLPRSSIVSSHTSAWEDVDDHVSVAPSDSISCAGSRRRSSRSYQ